MSDGLILELDEFILEGVIKFVEKHGVDVSKQLGLEIFEDTDSIWYGNLLDEAIKRIAKNIPVGNGDSGALVVNGENKLIGIQFAGGANGKAKAQAQEAYKTTEAPDWEAYNKTLEAWKKTQARKLSEEEPEKVLILGPPYPSKPEEGWPKVEEEENEEEDEEE